MKMADLVAELAAARAAMTDADRTALAGAGIPDRAIEIVGRMRIDLDREGRLFTPLEIGDPAFVVGCRIDERDADTPQSSRAEAIAFAGALVDLVAFSLETQDWALRADAAQWLGAIPPQLLDPEPVIIHRSPVGWLRSGCAPGFVILTRQPREMQRLINTCDKIVAEDPEHARELRRIARTPYAMPEISVAARRRRAA